MAAQPLENFVLLDAHCLPNMAPHIKRALILEAAMYSYAEIGALESVGDNTVESWLRTAGSEIGLCLPNGRTANKAMRGYWVGRHVSDCLAEETGAMSHQSA